jgi:cytochrome c oxidase assembly factor CtaG
VHGQRSSGSKVVYLFAAFVFGSPLGLLLALLPSPIYGFYEHVPRLWGLSPLSDQQIAGVTMASEQAIVFFAALALMLVRFFEEEERADRYRAPTASGGSPRSP